MNNPVLKRIIILIFFFGLGLSCQKEDENNLEDPILLEAKIWYENIKTPDLITVTKNLSSENFKASPRWKDAFISKNKDFKSVEIPLDVVGEFGFATADNSKAFKETCDKRYIESRTSLIIIPRGKKTIGFLMTIIPDKDFLEGEDFNAFSSSYKKWQLNFSGIVLYHDLNGSFSNGWIFENGRAMYPVKYYNTKIPLDMSKSCRDWYWVEWSYTCNGTSDLSFKGSGGCVYNEQWTYLYTDCEPAGGGGEGGSGGGACDGGYLPPSDIPCIGDPIKNPAICPSSGSGLTGGMFGCVRLGSSDRCPEHTKPHDGLDIECPLNSDIYAMYPGYVFNLVDRFSIGQCEDGSYGNWVIIRTSDQDGNYFDIFYAHLNRIDVAKGDEIFAGQIIGQSGNTGNASDYGIRPHLHVEVRKSELITNNRGRVDPAQYFATNFNSNGTINLRCD